MIQNIIKISFLPLVAALLFVSFSTKDKTIPEEFHTGSSSFFYTVTPPEKILADASTEIKLSPMLGKNYIGFKEAVAFMESGGNYHVINEFGYVGKYQFGRGTLELLGIYNLQEFLDKPHLQEAAFYANASRNKWILQRDIKRFEGKVINGIEITESGILAAAHLAGPGNVKKYLRSGGAVGFTDAFGTSISYYLKRFAGYNTSFVKMEKNARVKLKKKAKNLSEL